MADAPTLDVTGNIMYVTGNIVLMSPGTVFNKVYWPFCQPCAEYISNPIEIFSKDEIMQYRNLAFV